MWYVVIVIVIVIVIAVFNSFRKNLAMDAKELDNESLDAKFSTLVFELNEYAFGGKGHVKYNNYIKGIGGSVRHDNSHFHLYAPDSNQIILFDYSTGILTVTWKYKYFNQETELQKSFRNARFVTDQDQIKIAEVLISEMEVVVQNHKNRINGD